MNKQQIKTLAEQAGYRDLPTVRLAFYGFDKAKFAELIVKECAKIPFWCIETGPQQLEQTYMAEHIAKTIKEHFGVSE